MKKNVSRMLSVILAICMVVSLVPFVWATESADTVEILMLDTSDIHGQLYATDYTADASASGTYRQGLTRVATYIKEMREQYPNFFLADTGDTVQGTPLTYYFAFEEHTMADPTVKAMRTLGYDMWVLGNHEFNYGMTVLNEQVDYAIAEATEGETPITMSMANYLAAETNSDESKDWATWRGFEPYVIREYDGVKVAIMGIGNPGIPQWDVPANWEGIYFANPIETYDHYEAEMLEKADVIVLMSHSGIDIEGDGTGYIRQLIETHDSVDLVFSGHEHRDGVTMIADASGEIIPVVSPSTKCNKIGKAIITYNKTTDTCTVAAENVNMRNYAIDAELEAILKPYEEAAWNDYMLQPIGTASADFPAAGLGDAPSAFMDLINRVQLAYAYDYNGQNTPNDPTDDQMAQLSISAPLTSGNAANIIPAGDIVLGDLFRLYRYENWFYQITMTGKEVRTWLEFAATNVRSDGTASNLTYYDVIYGDGFYYEINAKAPEGSRVTKMTYNGADVADDQVFTVVVNNYRYNGGGNYVKYLNEHGCEFIPNDPDRIIYSTQYDMIQGEDQGQARNMLANYIRAHKVIDPTITSTWEITTEAPSTFEFAVVSTTDMHGRSTKFDVATQKEDVNSMVRAASVIKALREQYGDDMVLIDNGDTIQGNLVAQYAINQKADVLNPMMDIMIDLGYDTWTMGNHEFNFNPAQRDTQAQFALQSGMTALAANITLVESGKNMFGEDVAAGAPFYAPYVVKTLTDDFGREVKVAVIGFGNPANATWDLASNYPNMQFSSLENPNGDLAYEFQKWIDVVNEKEAVDVIVISSHNGFGNENGTSLENQTQYATANSAGADLVIAGHDHTARITTVTNKDGEAVPVVNAGGSNVNLNTFTVTFDANGGVADVAIEAENIALKDVEGDEATAQRTQHWYDETYAWASAPVGTFDNGWTALADQFTGKTNNQMVTFQNALVDFVHKGQIWASWQSYEELGIEGATVSIGSAVFAEDWSNGGALGFVPVDGTTISTLELNKLYRYSNNLLCAIDMTGEQLWNWMNTTVNYYDVDENGNIYLNSSVFGTDTFYGVDYTVDLTKPYGERLVSATYQGQDLRDYDGLIRCTLNSYRLSGGYGFFEATGLTEADCCWTASMYLGSDRAPVPTMLGEYVAHMGTVTPNDKVSHGADSTWTIITEAQPEPELVAEGWSGYTTWRLTSDGVLTVSPTAERYNGKCNMANYHKVHGVLTLPWSAYADQITKVVIEEGVNAIGQMAFYELPNLTEVVLADSVEDVRNYAFKNCTSLTTINLGKVLVLREGAFYGCSSLTEADYSGAVVVAEWVFSRTGVTFP
ncbi:MAG: 5'-nucleotidase C-terminal domain-containing protein [Oscillospiraceae bacterium]|nr:5'-nucleotidase C-terminal domain-containing protein [Oscillospiraceae bacterium]